MISVLRTAVSGMQAAQARMQVAALNIANADTVGSLPNAVGVRRTRQAYQPVTTVQSTSGFGGVTATVRDKQPAHVETYSPSSPYADVGGMIAAPNVDVGEELTDMMSASNSFLANAMVARISSEMTEALFDALDPDRRDRRRWLFSV